MWIVFGTGVKARRVPGGARVERRCGQCDEVATFYEKEVTATFQLYFVELFDYQRHRVMACGCCGACYATDELGLPATRTGEAGERATIGESAARAAHGIGGYIDRAADALEAGVSNLLTAERPPALRRRPVEEEAPSDGEHHDVRVGVPERKTGVRIKID
jgi:hypothetical protein